MGEQLPYSSPIPPDVIDPHYSMKAHAEATVSDTDFAKSAERWPVDTPDTKEAYFIREIFDSMCHLTRIHSVLFLSCPHPTPRPLPNRSSRKDSRALGSTR